MGLEERSLSVFLATPGFLKEGAKETVYLAGVAVIGVQGDEDVLFLGEPVDGLGQHDGPEGGVIDCETGGKLSTPGRELDDSV